MRILVTGGFGYVGGRVACALALQGHEVVLASRRAQSAEQWLPQARTIVIDWADFLSVAQACAGMDIVIHAAGMNAQDCQLDPEKAFVVNASYTAILVKAAISARVKRMIFFSTAHVYSSLLSGTLTEQTLATNQHPYARSHLAGEQYLLHAENIETVVIRLSNAFGAPTHVDVDCWMLLVNDLCRQVVEHGKITLKSDSSQLRDFIPMSRVAAAVEHLLAVPLSENSENIFNVGSQKALRIGEMATLIASRCHALWGWFPEIEKTSPAQQYLSERLDFDINKLRLSGFEPIEITTQEIDETLFFCDSHFQKQSL